MKPNKFRFGRRGAALLTLGLLSFIYGVAIWAAADVPARVPAVVSQPIVLRSMLDWVYWGYIWMAAGALAIVQAVFRRTDRWAFTAVSFMWITWTAGLTAGHIVEPGFRTYVAPIIYLVIAALIFIVGGWAEPPEEIVEIDFDNLHKADGEGE